MSPKADPMPRSARTGLLWGLAALLVFSAAIRFYRLGDSDTRSDEVELIEFLQAGVGPMQYFKHIVAGFQSGRQMPLPRVATSAYVLGLHLDVTLFNIRTLYAFLNSLAPLFLVLLGRKWAGPRMGWILGILGAINPFSLYWARVGHVYGFVLPFVTMTAALFVPLLRDAAAGRSLSRGLLAAVAATSIGGCYSHLSAWPITGLLWLALLVLAFRAAGWRPKAMPIRLWIAFGIWALSVAPWAFSFLTAVDTKWDMLSVISNDPQYEFYAMRRLPFVMGWGSGGVGSILTFGLPALGLVLGVRNRAFRPGALALAALGLVLFVLLAAMMKLSGGIYTLRYFTPIWLVPLLLAGVAIHEVSVWAGGRIQHPKAGALAAGVWLGLIAANTAAPLWWIITLDGHPTPYTRINRWLDANLPRGAPVIVDRWFEPSHEMRFHSPTNVFVTFTIPNEPLTSFLENNWRGTVQQFAQRYPDAAYVELIKSYFYVPTVGSWDWPRRYFARQAAVTNEPALKLRERQLGMTEDFYADNTNRIVVEIFYNTVEDLVAKARADGRRLLLWYGPGWAYTKTRDFRDWRILEAVATLDLYNLTDAPLDAQLVLRGVAYNGTKRIMTSTGTVENFPPNREYEWKLSFPALPPGRTTLRLADNLWNTAHVPLLVSDMAFTAP